MTEKTNEKVIAPGLVRVVERKKIEHANIYEALSAFQGELKPMARSGEVDFPTQKGNVKFNYTPLEVIMAAIYPLLARHGLAIRHAITEGGVEAILTHGTYHEGGDVGVERSEGVLGAGNKVEKTYILRVANELRSGIIPLKRGEKMQDTGAAITYARRYSLTMLLGISSEDDKDATLIEASAKNAQGYAEGRARKSIEEAKTVAEVDKAAAVLRKDLEMVQKGKAGALGLSAETYEELLATALEKIDKLTNVGDVAPV
jgi:hypothetical protein